MDYLINVENIEQVSLQLSTINKNYSWLEERPQQIIKKWWRKEIIPSKPAGFYYNGNYDSPLDIRFMTNVLIDIEKKTIKTKPELIIIRKYPKGNDYFYYYFNSDEDATTAFNELKAKTNLLLINFVNGWNA